MSDEEIQALERRLATGDLEAWPLLDAALARAGRVPRRIWAVYRVTGEYSDRSDDVLEPVHVTKEAAIRHMAEYAAKEREAGRVWTKRAEDSERWDLAGDRGNMFIVSLELVQ